MSGHMLPAVAVAEKPDGVKTPKKKAVAKHSPVTAEIKEKAWTKFIGLVATGHKVPDSLAASGISRIALEGQIRTKPEINEQFEEAKLTSLRLHWDSETVEEILVGIAMNAKGSSVKVMIEDMGLSYYGFMRMVLKDPVVGAQYEEARQLQMEGMADDMLSISDSRDADTYETEAGHTKVNHDVVQRDKLRVDSRKWLMSKMHHKRFGDRIQQDVEMNVTVDHAETLEDARRRKEALFKARNVIEGEATEVDVSPG